MRLHKVSFNLLVFMGLCIQYALMHLFSAGEIIAISTAELVIYMLLTFAGLGTFFSRRRRALAQQGCGSVALFSPCCGPFPCAPSFVKKLIRRRSR